MTRLPVLIIALLFAFSSSATTFYVAIGGSDEDGCGSSLQPFASIRAALGNAVSGDTIRVGEGTFHTDTKYEVIKDNAVTVIGSGNHSTLLTAVSGIRLFEINGGLLTVKDVCIKEINNNQEGGAIIAKSITGKKAVLHCENVDFRNNSAKSSPVARVEGGSARFIQCNFIQNQSTTYGAIGLIANNYPFDEILVSGCLFDGNEAANNGSAIRIYVQNNVEKCDIINNTFINNRLTQNYGTIAIEGGNASGTNRNVRIIHNTIVNNTNVSDKTAGVFVNGTAGNIVEIINNIITDNPNSSGQSYSLQLANVSLKVLNNNIIDDYTAAQIKLQNLADNGGATHTMALSDGSVAINRGKTGIGITTDQRNYLRDHQPDIGAYEYDAIPANNISVDEMMLAVYPNPFVDYIIVNSVTDGFVTFYDLSGQAILSAKLKAGSNRIDTSALQQGVYFLSLTPCRIFRVERGITLLKH